MHPLVRLLFPSLSPGDVASEVVGDVVAHAVPYAREPPGRAQMGARGEEVCASDRALANDASAGGPAGALGWVLRGVPPMSIWPGHGELLLPWSLRPLLPLMLLVPPWMMDWTTGFVGGWYGMDRFQGRPAVHTASVAAVARADAPIGPPASQTSAQVAPGQAREIGQGGKSPIRRRRAGVPKRTPDGR